jgi:benzoate-CoA ligase family protein
MGEDDVERLMSEPFNACTYLLDRQVEGGNGSRTALTGSAGELTYAELLDRVVAAGASLRRLGLQPEQRLLLFMADSPDLVALFLAALRVGAIPVPVSTMSRPEGLAQLLRDSRARLLAVSPEFNDVAGAAVAEAPELTGILATSGAHPATDLPVHSMADLTARRAGDEAVYGTTADSPAFWLYTSGTTGTPKAAMHRHGAVKVVCETYGHQVLGIRAEDRCLSAAKVFFAYGLGNSVLFPMSVGAAAILEPAPSRPDVLAEAAQKYDATLFFGGPTFFANMLRADMPAEALSGVRLAVSAGEALPASLYERWTSRFGIDIIDGLGMTEMLHIFLSNRPGQVHPGTTGVPVPGYELRLLDETGTPVPPGEPGTLFVRGASSASGYWSRYDASRQVFQGEWLRTGDTYVEGTDGSYTCLGRSGDMLKAGGIWVSPAEVETQLLAHPAVNQAVVVAGIDPDGLEKPVAYVALHRGAIANEDELIEFCRTGLPSFKRPRRVVFVETYPTTPTGKIRRVELRHMATGALAEPSGGEAG